MPKSCAIPLAMGACNLDNNDLDVRAQFLSQYSAELGRVGSKVKNESSNLFVETLLTLYQLPRAHGPHTQRHNTHTLPRTVSRPLEPT